MGRTNFEKLRVYRLAEELADAIWNIVMNWSQFERDTVDNRAPQPNAYLKSIGRERSADGEPLPATNCPPRTTDNGLLTTDH
jgi:hypothetical protein